MKLNFIFAWYDFWVGVYWDSDKRKLYIFPVPCFGVCINLPGCWKCKGKELPCSFCGLVPKHMVIQKGETYEEREARGGF